MSKSQKRHRAAADPGGLSLAFHGAAGTVTGSKHLLTAAGSRILLDAGLFQGLKELRLRNWEPPGFDLTAIDHVVLSHTHIDHVGFLPRLVKLGLDAPVHCTPAAFDLAKLMLLDSARLQEEDARRANRKGYSKHKPALPLYTTGDAWDALDLRRRESYDEWFDLHPDGKVGIALSEPFLPVAIPDALGVDFRGGESAASERWSALRVGETVRGMRDRHPNQRPNALSVRAPLGKPVVMWPATNRLPIHPTPMANVQCVRANARGKKAGAGKGSGGPTSGLTARVLSCLTITWISTT